MPLSETLWVTKRGHSFAKLYSMLKLILLIDFYMTGNLQGDGTGGGGLSGAEDQTDKRIPFQLHASINEPGLGLLSWWKSG